MSGSLGSQIWFRAVPLMLSKAALLGAMILGSCQRRYTLAEDDAHRDPGVIW
jgi:hypothetical protein